MASNWTHGATTTPAGAPTWGGDPQLWTTVLGLPAEALRRARRLLTITGVLALLAGAAAIIVPAVASVATAIFIGWILVVAGVVMVVHALSPHERAEGRALRLINALLTLAIGIYLLVAPLSGTLTLTVLVAAWFFATGVLGLWAAWRNRDLPGAGLLALNGALSLILGVLITVDLPSSAGWAIGLLVGVNLVFWGIRALVLASLLRRLPGV